MAVPIQQMYINLATADKDKVRIVPKYRGDHDPFQSFVGDYVINNTKHTSNNNLVVDHSQTISKATYQKMLALNQTDLPSTGNHKQVLARANDNVAIAAPLKSNGLIDTTSITKPQTGFNFQQIQQPLEQHSQSAHSMVNALGHVDKQAANQIKADDKYKFGQYDDKVVDSLPNHYFDQHPLPIGPTLNDAAVKKMLYNGHTMVMASARDKTATAIQNVVNENGSLLAHTTENDKNGQKPKPKKKKSFDTLINPFTRQSQVTLDSSGSPTTENNSFDQVQAHQSFNQSLDKSFSQLITQRYIDHQRFNDGDNDSASVFEDDYEPKDLEDVQSEIGFNKEKAKLGLSDTKSTDQRNKYLTTLLTNRQSILENNSDSLLADSKNDDSPDDVDDDVDQRGGSDEAKKARLERKNKLRRQTANKKKKQQLELYAESIYAMQYHDDQGNAKYQYNMVAKQRPVNGQANDFIANAQYHNENNQVATSHSIPLDKQGFDNIMAANDKSVSPTQVAQSVQKGQAIAGKHDNIAFQASLQKTPNGVTIDNNSITPTEQSFDYRKEIEQSATKNTQNSKGLVKSAQARKKPFTLNMLSDPHKVDASQKKAHASLTAALDAALANPEAFKPTHTKSKQAQSPSLN